MNPIQTPRDAELAVAAWLSWAGHNKVRATQYASDGGIDVESDRVAVQVKFQAQPVGRPALQAIKGAAMVRNRDAWFVSLGGYSRQAAEWADSAEVALFKIDVEGRIQPFNQIARTVFDEIDATEAPPAGVPPIDPSWYVRTGPRSYLVVEEPQGWPKLPAGHDQGVAVGVMGGLTATALATGPIGFVAAFVVGCIAGFTLYGSVRAIASATERRRLERIDLEDEADR